MISTMLTETMSSRIFGTAREKGWVYGMGSGSSLTSVATGWWMGAQVSKTNSQPLLRLIRDECIRLRNGEIDNEDFLAAQKNVLGKTMRAGQTASSLVNMYGRYYMNDEIDDLNKLPARLKSVTANKCKKVFKELCDEGVWGMGLLGSTSLVPARKLSDYASEIFEN
jgi:predicted Zn-dependent peptidase